MNWSLTPELLDIEKLEFKNETDFIQLLHALLPELNDELRKANRVISGLATEEELLEIVKTAVAQYPTNYKLGSIYIWAYLRVRQFLFERLVTEKEKWRTAAGNYNS
jgi:hypothetical protein